MKRFLLLNLLMTLVGVFTVSATSVVINVDNADNVDVYANYGYGRKLDLADGLNVFDLSDTDDSPLKITAREGAAIESVVMNETDNVEGNGGEYLVRFYTSGIKIDITTSGNGSASNVRDVSIQGFYAMGEGISGSPFTVTYEKDGEWVETPKDTWGFHSIPEGSSVKVTPVAPYVIDSLSLRDGTFETMRLDDGSYTFVCDYDTFFYQSVYVNMSVSPEAIRFSLTVDYASNITAALERRREGEWQWLSLHDGRNDFVCVPSDSPLEIFAADGASVIMVQRNGETVSQTGWGGVSGWIYELEDGDEFVVATQGKEVNVMLTAPEGNASLENYVFTSSDGCVIEPDGMEYTVRAHVGETVYVTPRPGTEISYLLCQNGGQTDMLTYFRVAEGVDGVNPMSVSLYGTRVSSDITIIVDDASRVQVVQEGGRGDVLELHDGSNTFQPSDIRNTLAISASDGNQMISVSKNGNAVAPNAGGVYPVMAEASDWIEIVSRRNPVDVTLNFTFDGSGELSWIKGSVDGQEISIDSPMTVKSYTTITISAREGYTLRNVATTTEGVVVERAAGGAGYAVTIPSADILSADIIISVEEMEAEEGYAVVTTAGEEIFVMYSEYTLSESGEFIFVKRLENNTVNQVKIGNYVRVYCKDTQSRFLYVRVNGEDVATEPDSDGRIAFVRIGGRTLIEAEIYTPCQAYTQSTYDDVRHIVAGNVYFDMDGSLETQIYPTAGQSVKFSPAPERGYLFDHIEMFYSNTIDSEGIIVEGNEYTFTESDVKENFILFKGVFIDDPDEKAYVVRGSTAWLIDENGDVVTDQSGAIGNVVFQMPTGENSREITGVEGDRIQMFVEVYEDVRDQYEVEAYCFMRGFPDNRISGSVYTINSQDADNEGVIWINALIRRKAEGIGEVIDGSDLFYDAENRVIVSSSPVKVYSLSGTLMLSGSEESLSVDRLPEGVYIIVSGGSTLKFTR